MEVEEQRTGKAAAIKRLISLSHGEVIVLVGADTLPEPTAIEQLGAKVQMITADDLAWGDLSRFDAIVTGVRAYERRPDLRASNYRLIEYAEAGGT